jgi:hypothetical protein
VTMQVSIAANTPSDDGPADPPTPPVYDDIDWLGPAATGPLDPLDQQPDDRPPVGPARRRRRPQRRKARGRRADAAPLGRGHLPRPLGLEPGVVVRHRPARILGFSYMHPPMLSHLVAFRLGRPSMMLLTLCRAVWK